MVTSNYQTVFILLQDYIEIIIKKHEILTIICPINVYISEINNRLVFTIKMDIN